MKKRLIFVMLVLSAVTVVAIAASWLSVDWTDEGAGEYAGGMVLRDSAGRVMRVSLGPNDVDCRPYYEADPEDWIVKAIVASEDGTFWTHRGVRPFSALRAAFQNVTTGRRVSGASTITMQAVRLIAPHPKSLKWKIIEAVKALKMERKKDKLWILSQYLNRAPYGSNFVGIEAAANGWFGKGAKSLGIGEAACLAGMVQAPSRFRPDRALDSLLKRREYVLARMLKLGYITEEQRQAALSVMPVVCRAPRPFKHPFFCDWVAGTLGRDREAQKRGGDIVTTLDADIQRLCELTVDEAQREGGYSSAAVVMRVDTGAVVALACSGNYFAKDNGQVNTALSPRPAGSTLKPFLAALALDRGLVTPEERLADVPCAYKGYRPSNFDNKYRGLVTLRDSLVLSLNIPFVRLLNKIGVAEFGTALRSVGFGHMADGDETYGLGMAIGNVEVTLVELVAAYATLARGGIYRPPVATPDGVVRGGGAGARVFSSGAAYLVSDMLSGDERSQAALGHVADVETSRFAWKTGTSSAFRDAWTVAWNPEYVVGVWCGHKFGGFGDMSLVGAKASAPQCWKIARSLYPQNDGPWFVEPRDVVRRKVCSHSGLPANPDCPATETGHALAGRSSDLKCACHFLDADGKLVTKDEPDLAALFGTIGKAEKLKISKPENNAVFCLVPGLNQQKIICQVVGNPAKSRLWWFDNGTLRGTSTGTDPFVLGMSCGNHVLTCSTAEGVSSSVVIFVEGRCP